MAFTLGHGRRTGTGINGRAEPFFDNQSGPPELKLLDFSISGSTGTGADKIVTQDELFEMLWGRVVDALERS